MHIFSLTNRTAPIPTELQMAYRRKLRNCWQSYNFIPCDEIFDTTAAAAAAAAATTTESLPTELYSTFTGMCIERVRQRETEFSFQSSLIRLLAYRPCFRFQSGVVLSRTSTDHFLHFYYSLCCITFCDFICSNLGSHSNRTFQNVSSEIFDSRW